MNIAEYTEILRCPHCAGKGRGELTAVKQDWLACECGRQYPIIEGIPVMMPDEGEKWFKNYNFGHAVYNFGINYPF